MYLQRGWHPGTGVFIRSYDRKDNGGWTNNPPGLQPGSISRTGNHNHTLSTWRPCQADKSTGAKMARVTRAGYGVSGLYRSCSWPDLIT
jgi:hypothetical protein